MFTGNNWGAMDLSTLLTIGGSLQSTPKVLQDGLLGQIKTLPYEWAVSHTPIVKYSMKTTTKVKGSPAITDANVVPNIRASMSVHSAIVGRCEANILYHRRANTSIEVNNGVMHADSVLDAYSEWVHEMSKIVNHSLINGYEDREYTAIGLKGMGDFATEINSAPLDPTNYASCYKFFAEQIDILTSDLNIDPSRVRVIIGRDAVQAMQMTPITGTSTSVWDLLQSSVLDDVYLSIVPKEYHQNQCSFIALDYISPVVVANSPFATLGQEKDVAGNHQFAVYAECMLPSVMVTDSLAVRHQSNMIVSNYLLNATARIGKNSKKLSANNSMTEQNVAV